MMTTQIYLVRHGQTEWNRQNRLQGHRNSPLTDLGRQQAGAAAKALSDQAIDKAYVSPLQRARETLDIILEKRDVEIAVSDNLKEINLGPWEGRKQDELELVHSVQLDNFWNRHDRFSLDGAETFQQLQTRVATQLDEILELERGKNILVVSHGMAIKMAIAHYTKTPIGDLSHLPVLENGRFLTIRQSGATTTVEGL